MSIVLLGGKGYVGTAFRKLFERSSIAYITPTRAELNLPDPEALSQLIREIKPAFLINAAGFTGKPNVDQCEIRRAECLEGNVILPKVLRDICAEAELPWGHVSSGCIYSGRRADGAGFCETDPPNFSFRNNNCSFYSGCKVLGEEYLAGEDACFIWRMRIPFNELDSPRNYLSKLLQYECLLDCENSLSQLDEFATACWKTWASRAPFGTYNVTNPGAITTREVVDIIRRELNPNKEFKFFRNEEDFYRLAAQAPRSNCVLDSSKLKAAGISLANVEDAIRQALRRFRAAN